MRKLESVVATIVVAPALEAQVGKAPNHAEVSSHGEVHTDSQNIRAHVKFLSSDLLEGREDWPAGRRHRRRLHRDSVCLVRIEIAGDHGTYFQNVPLVGVTTLDKTSSFLTPAGPRCDVPYPESRITSIERTSETLAGSPVLGYFAPCCEASGLATMPRGPRNLRVAADGVGLTQFGGVP